MPSSGMWHCMALVRTDIFEEWITSIIRVERSSELGTIASCQLLLMLFLAH
jgi:hypothetical protein